MNKVQMYLTLVISITPGSSFKNFLLRQLGHDIHPTAKFGPNLVIGKTRILLREGSRVRPFNILRNIRLELGSNSIIGSWNWFSAAPALATLSTYKPVFQLGSSTAINSRNYFDCSGGITFGSFADLAGVRSTFVTHYIDTKLNEQTCKPIVIGARTMLSSNLIAMPGATVGAKSIVAAGTVLIGRTYPGESLIAGNPGQLKSPKSGAWFERNQGPVLPIDKSESP